MHDRMDGDILTTLHHEGRRFLQKARLPLAIFAVCLEALQKPGRLFSAEPIWASLFLSWCETLQDQPLGDSLSFAVACEFMIAAYDLLDDAYESDGSVSNGSRSALLTGSVSLLLFTQEIVARSDIPSEQRVYIDALCARAGRRALAAQHISIALRTQSNVSMEDILWLLPRRSGILAAVPCQSAAVLCHAPWRIIGLAGRFGTMLACAAQLEDDLTDYEEDTQAGRYTLPTLLARHHPDTPDLLEAVTWVMIRQFLTQAAQAVTALPLPLTRTTALWRLLPPDLHPAGSGYL